MKRILIIKPSSLGDIIHGLQIAANIKYHLPSCHITWISAKAFAPLVQAAEPIDKTLIFHRDGGIGAFFKLIEEIREQKYDITLDLQGLARSALMTLASRAPQKIGRSDAREFATLAYNKKFSPPTHTFIPHALEILLQALPELDFPSKLKAPLTFKPTLNSSNITEDLLAESPILLFPNSRRKEKEYPHFGELALALAQEYPSTPIILLGSEPLENVPQKDTIHNLIGKTKLTDLIPLLNAAKLSITNDSGPMHLSAAMFRPTIGLFGPTNPKQYGPYPLCSERNIAIEAPHHNLHELTVDQILEHARSLTANSSTPHTQSNL